MMQFRKPVSILLIVALSACLVACGGGVYRASNMKVAPGEAPAYVEHLNPARSAFVISHVDGAPRGVGIFHQYMLAAGKRSFRLTAAYSLGKNEKDPSVFAMDRAFVSPPMEVEFVAEPGGAYLIDTTFDPATRTFTARIVEKQTAKVVGSTSAPAK